MARKYGFANCQPQVASQFIVQYTSLITSTIHYVILIYIKKTTDILDARKLFENIGCL